MTTYIEKIAQYAFFDELSKIAKVPLERLNRAALARGARFLRQSGINNPGVKSAIKEGKKVLGVHPKGKMATPADILEVERDLSMIPNVRSRRLSMIYAGQADVPKRYLLK